MPRCLLWRPLEARIANPDGTNMAGLTAGKPKEIAMPSKCLGALSAVLILIAATPALADRDPTDEERAQIEAALQSLGFTSWDEIELDDDGYWEIDDAEGSDGQEFELRLAPDTFEVIERKAD